MKLTKGGALTSGADGERGNPTERASEGAPSINEPLGLLVYFCIVVNHASSKLSHSPEASRVTVSETICSTGR